MKSPQSGVACFVDDHGGGNAPRIATRIANRPIRAPVAYIIAPAIARKSSVSVPATQSHYSIGRATRRFMYSASVIPRSLTTTNIALSASLAATVAISSARLPRMRDTSQRGRSFGMSRICERRVQESRLDRMCALPAAPPPALREPSAFPRVYVVGKTQGGQ
jgi:hypothetical protein